MGSLLMPGWIAGLGVALAWEAWALRTRGQQGSRQTLSEAFWSLRDRAPWLAAGAWAALTAHFFLEEPRR